ncbi:MAG TPA: hypothetical protein VLV15_17250 [Dongiaceae bacterium]|nr:hypothetical protein [Dongiaceae bacterium]
MKPLAPQRFGMQVTIDAETHELLRDVQGLLGHTIPSGDLGAVLRESLRLAKLALEKRRFAQASKRRPGRRSKRMRYVTAHVRREVWKRDQGRCTFVSDSGHRCESRTRLEFDYATPLARGGEGTVDDLRLRCRAHNQYEAERAFGESFMRGKREAARRGAADQRAKERLAPKEPNAPPAPERNSVLPWLRSLGFRAAEARQAAARCDAIADASLEQRVKLALASLSPGRTFRPVQIAT